MRRCATKAGVTLGSILAITLVLNSVVYACSKIGMVMAMHESSMAMATDAMDDGAFQRDPCAQHRQDVCKSVRDRLLSVQPSLYKLDPAQQPIAILLPSNPASEIPRGAVASFGSLGWQTAFHSVFKLPLPLSLSVLRI